MDRPLAAGSPIQSLLGAWQDACVLACCSCENRQTAYIYSQLLSFTNQLDNYFGIFPTSCSCPSEAVRMGGERLTTCMTFGVDSFSTSSTCVTLSTDQATQRHLSRCSQPRTWVQHDRPRTWVQHDICTSLRPAALYCRLQNIFKLLSKDPLDSEAPEAAVPDGLSSNTLCHVCLWSDEPC